MVGSWWVTLSEEPCQDVVVGVPSGGVVIVRQTRGLPWSEVLRSEVPGLAAWSLFWKVDR